MNKKIKQLAEQAGLRFTQQMSNPMVSIVDGKETDLEKFAQLLLRNLAEELSDVAQRSKQTNPEWANGIDHAAMLAQRMTMNLPQWPEAE